jgi:concanavalin A-like lectin/glucanase superfamily protein/type IX secretion system substrate protein
MRQYIFGLVLLMATSVFSQSIGDNLLLFYRFNGDTNDSSGNGYTGTPHAITYGPDRFGNPNSAAYFNGIDSFVNFPNLAVLKPDLPVSFSFFIKYTSDDYHNQVVFNTSFEENQCTGVWFNSSLTNNGHAVNYGDGALSYSPDTRRTFLCYKAVVINDWRQITVVVNSESDMKIYFDCSNTTGTFSGTGGSLVYSPAPGCIGRHDRNLSEPADYFQGYIDDFRYWDRALTPEDNALICENLAVSDFQPLPNTLTIYPNPTSDRLNVETNMQDIELFTVYNSLGQQMYAGDFLPVIDVSNFLAGIYFITIKADQGTVTKKIVVGN